MKRKGKVIQIILNKDLNKYMFTRWVMEEMIKTEKDLVVLKNPECPGGIKGYFMSFKQNYYDENIFPILMDSKNIKEGDLIDIDCQKFKVECFCYIDKKVKK